jgi:integrase
VALRSPARIVATSGPFRGLYALRHSFASFAIRNRMDSFTLSRLMGTSLQMIDQHYGHLLQGADAAALRFLSPESSPKVDPAEESQ